MGLLDDLVGGGQRRTDFQDFIDRWTRAGGATAVSDEETVQRYQEVAPELSTEAYRDSAQDAFARLSPEERAQFAEWMRTRAVERGMSTEDLDGNGQPDRLQDPAALAEATTRMRDRDPSIFEQLLGKGGTGGPLDNPIAKLALAGITAMAAQRLMGGRR